MIILRLEILGHQAGSHADQAVEGGNELGQRRHLDAQRDKSADRPADGDAGDDRGVVHHARLGQCRTDGDDHADDAEAVARL